MICDNNAARLHHEIMIRLCELFFAGELEKSIDRLPIDMRPKEGDSTRCCIHRDRALIKYRCMAALGVATEDETDELTPLNEYARKALAAEKAPRPERFLSIMADACAGCVRNRYYVTNACQGCLARPCSLNCPKKAIGMVDGHARIDAEKCVNCGKCTKVCPYHAIVYVPIPCEEACPAGALSRGVNGKQKIDDEKCILCGKCRQACPFGAILEVSEMFRTLHALAEPRRMAALYAPALLGQFDANAERIAAALRKLGFSEVVEVASGADETARLEAEEFVERMAAGDELMTNSCCPAWKLAIEKRLPNMQKYISHTKTPLQITAARTKERIPDAFTVFIGPCLAKRWEAAEDENVDAVLSFDELGSILVAAGIDVEEQEGEELDCAGGPCGRRFPISGGVTAAIAANLPENAELVSRQINGLDQKTLKLLQMMPKARSGANFLEVMACEGGCVGGPSSLCGASAGARRLTQVLAECEEEVKGAFKGG